MCKKLLSIFTPTYNRGRLLIKVFESLQNQTDKDFEWIIVDDGSTDDTSNIVSRIIDVALFPIKYIHQKNGGKYTAYNTVLDMKINGKFFVCLDSDDILYPDAVAIIRKECTKLPKENIGCIFRMNLGNFALDRNWSKASGNFADAIDMREIYHIPESVSVTRTSVITKYRFPINLKELNQKYCAECVLHTQFIRDGKYKLINESIYEAEYQQDGMTNNLFTKTWINNPDAALLGLCTHYNISFKYTLVKRIIIRTKCILNINAFCMKVGRNIFYETPSVAYSVLLFVPSILFRYYRFER